MSTASLPHPGHPPSIKMTSPQPVGAIYGRLEHVERQLALVQGFVQKLFGPNFEEYCQSRLQSAETKVKRTKKNVRENSGKSKLNVIQTENQVQSPSLEKDDEADAMIVEHYNSSVKLPNEQPSVTINGETTNVTPTATSTDTPHQDQGQGSQEDSVDEGQVTHSEDPLVNPFLETTEETDPIAIDNEGFQSSTSVSGDQVGGGEVTEEGGCDDAPEAIPGLSETNDEQQEFPADFGENNQEQDSDRLFFFDDGVDQHQFAGYFDEEDAEPFQTMDEERDVKVLTILDIPDAYPSTSQSIGELENNFSYSNKELDNDSRIRIKPEHGQPMDSEDFNIVGGGSSSSGSTDLTETHRASSTSLPSTSTSNGPRRRGRPPKSAAGPSGTPKSKKIKTEGGNASDDQDSDFKLESDEDPNAEFSSSSSSSDDDPDWRAKPKPTPQPIQPRIKGQTHPSPFVGGALSFKNRRGRRPNYIKNSGMPPNLVPLLPKSSTFSGGPNHSFTSSCPNGRIVFNLTSSSSPVAMVPVPGSKAPSTSTKRGRPRSFPPPHGFSYTPARPQNANQTSQQLRVINPITQLPKIINGVYYRLISLSADKRNQNVMIVKAKCALCDGGEGSKPVIVVGFGKSEANFYEHFKEYHPADYLHYRANAQKIDAATVKLRQVISKHSPDSGPNNEAIFISQYLRKITNLSFVS